MYYDESDRVRMGANQSIPNPESGDGRNYYSDPWISVADLPEHSFPTVPITQEERQAIELHGAERAKYTPGPAEIEKEVRGLGGELAFSKAFDGVVDTNQQDGGDGGYDFDIRGTRVDVKTRSRRVNNPDLLVSSKNEIRADCYVLIQERSRYDYQILGSIESP